MSHSTVLVVLSDTDVELIGLDEALAKALEKFDENKDTPRFVKYTREQAIEKQRKETLAYRDGLYAEYLADPAKYRADTHARHYRYISEEFPTILAGIDDDEIMHATAVQYESDVDAEGNVYSTYNPRSYRLDRVTTNHNTEGLVGSGHDQREEADQSAGEKVLFEVRDDEGSGGVSEGGTVARRSLHLLLPLHQGAQQAADSEAAAGLDDPREVQDGAGGVRRPAGETGWSVRNLQGAADDQHTVDGTATAGGRSLPLDGHSAGLTLHSLQHGDRVAEGFTLIADSRDDLPAIPDGWTWTGPVSGAKWDWYSIGGRWSGAVLNATETIHHKAKVINEHYTQDAWDELTGGVDYLQVKDLTTRRGTFAYLDKDGEWHERGRMGWFGMAFNATATEEEFDAQVRERITALDPTDWLVVVDVHI